MNLPGQSWVYGATDAATAIREAPAKPDRDWIGVGPFAPMRMVRATGSQESMIRVHAASALGPPGQSSNSQ
jgi:hypothetical protein